MKQPIAVRRAANTLQAQAARSLSQPKKLSLSKREHQVMSLAARGLIDMEIARQMGISLGTARVYVKRVYKKLDVNNRRDAINQLIKLKIIEAPPLEFAVPLSRQQERVLLALVDGKIDKEIARDMGVSIGSVRIYKNRLRAKCGNLRPNEIVARFAAHQRQLAPLPADKTNNSPSPGF